MDAFSSSTLSTLPSQIPLLSQTKKPPLSLPSSSSSQRKTSLSSSSQRKTSSSSSSARTMIVNTINNLFNNLMMINSNYKLQPSLDPKRALSNNFAPVDEVPPTQCQVIQGSLPSCLDEPYHLFDGDAMLHCIRISQGQATFCSRCVKTYKYTLKTLLVLPLFPVPSLASVALLRF
ncbi:hypothetical protein AB3S75_029666 [Citrus x aurantiifolia]